MKEMYLIKNCSFKFEMIGRIMTLYQIIDLADRLGLKATKSEGNVYLIDSASNVQLGAVRYVKNAA